MNRSIQALAGAVLAAGLAASAAYAAGRSEIVIDDTLVYPESITNSADGAMFMGSIPKHMIFRADPGAKKAEPWIKPGAGGLESVVGVLADDKDGVLWACSSDMEKKTAALKAFNLKTGAFKASYDLPGGGLCNDIVMARNGDAYITETNGGRVLRLKKGAKDLEVWAKDAKLSGADGLIFGPGGNLYVNTYTTSILVRVDVKPDGSAGAVTQLKTSLPLDRPDGLRIGPDGKTYMVEGQGRLDRVTIDGDNAKIDVLKSGWTIPSAVAFTPGTAWVLEAKLNYLMDPKFKGQDPGQFKVWAVPLK